jgi:hypothetical protein
MGTVNRRYVSEHTLWMREMQATHPEWAEAQVSGRELWWDRPQACWQDLQQSAAFTQGREAAKAYPYDVNFGAQQVNK